MNRPIARLKRKLKWFFVALVVGFALLQLTNPARTNPPVVSDLMASNPPPQVAALLRAACYDCHSSETRWPWYSRVAPMSWLIASDVKGVWDKVKKTDLAFVVVDINPSLEQFFMTTEENAPAMHKFPLMVYNSRTVCDSTRMKLTSYSYNPETYPFEESV